MADRDLGREVERLAEALELIAQPGGAISGEDCNRSAALLRALWEEHEAVVRMISNDGVDGARWDASEFLKARDEAVRLGAHIEALLGGEDG